MSTVEADSPDGDYELAKQLQEQFDRELVDISSGDDEPEIVPNERSNNTLGDQELACQLQRKYETVELSDDDDAIFLSIALPQRTIRNAVKQENANEVKLYRAKREDLNGDEYFIEELQTYVDPENNFEWKFINVIPDIRSIFEKFDQLFFQSRFKPKNFNVIWSRSMGTECTNRNFNDADGRYTIALNETLLTLRPRIEIISILLHEMIHAFLKHEGVKEANDGHGSNFRKIMSFLNRMIQTNIGFGHRLTNLNTVSRTQWYRCTGICHNYKPFMGIVRSDDGPPGLQNEWWKNHADSCGGTYYKIYEMSKIEDDEVHTRFAVNVRYMLPKRENVRGRHKTKLPPKVSIDLTCDQPRIIPSASTSEIIAVDDHVTADTDTDTSAADKFILEFHRRIAFTRDTYEMQCPVCQERTKRKLFGSHIDGCKGYVERVVWKRTGGGKVVQNGLLEQQQVSQEHQTASISHDAGRRLGSSSTVADFQRIKRQRFG